MSWLSEFLSASPKKKRKVTDNAPEDEEEEDEDTNLSSILDVMSGGRHEAMPMQELNSRAIKFLLSKFLGAK